MDCLFHQTSCEEISSLKQNDGRSYQNSVICFVQVVSVCMPLMGKIREGVIPVQYELKHRGQIDLNKCLGS